MPESPETRRFNGRLCTAVQPDLNGNRPVLEVIVTQLRTPQAKQRAASSTAAADGQPHALPQKRRC